MNIELKKDGFKSERLISFRKLNIQPTAEEVYITDVGFFPNAKGHYVERPNGTSENILIFCSNGNGFIEINGSHPLKLSKNELFIIPKESSHLYYASKEDPWSIYWVHYNQTHALRFPPLNKKIKIKEKELQFLLKILFNEIINGLEIGTNKLNIEFSNHTLKYLLESINYLPKIYENSINKYTNPLIGIIVNFTEENIHKKITLDDFSKILDCSKSHVNKIFMDELNTTPIEYVINRKLEYAETLLRTTILSISEISRKIGINDSLYFSKCFKKKYNYSPTLYRVFLKEQSNSY